jgi:hypothetical protein
MGQGVPVRRLLHVPTGAQHVPQAGMLSPREVKPRSHAGPFFSSPQPQTPLPLVGFFPRSRRARTASRAPHPRVRRRLHDAPLRTAAAPALAAGCARAALSGQEISGMARRRGRRA